MYKDRFCALIVILITLSVCLYDVLLCGVKEKQQKLMQQYGRCGLSVKERGLRIKNMLEEIDYVCLYNDITKQSLLRIINMGFSLQLSKSEPGIVNPLITKKLDQFIAQFNQPDQALPKYHDKKSTMRYLVTIFILDITFLLCKEYGQRSMVYESLSKKNKNFEQDDLNAVLGERAEKIAAIMYRKQREYQTAINDSSNYHYDDDVCTLSCDDNYSSDYSQQDTSGSTEDEDGDRDNQLSYWIGSLSISDSSSHSVDGVSSSDDCYQHCKDESFSEYDQQKSCRQQRRKSLKKHK